MDGGAKHGVRTVGGTAHTYDVNGCMTSKGDLSIKYDPERRPVRVKQGATTLFRVAYDGDGVRRKRLDSSGTIHYVGPYERKVAGGAEAGAVVTKYYHAALGPMQRLIAFRRDGTLYYVGTDHLGSTIRVVDSSFGNGDSMRYTCFGVGRDPGTNLKTDHRFTGQIEDASIGLYWYARRAYDPAIGRFTCPDAIVPEPGNPQALNRYSYCLGNPLKYVDPTGRRMEFPVDEGDAAVTRGDSQDLATPVASDSGCIPTMDGGSVADQELPGEPTQIWDRAVGYLLDFLFEQGENERIYGPATRETMQMRSTIGAQKMRQEFYAGGMKSGSGTWESGEAFLATISDLGNATQARVGGYEYRYRNNGDGSVTFYMVNDTGRDSFLYHIHENVQQRVGVEAPFFADVQRGDGHWFGMGNIKETYYWTERIRE